MQHRPAPAFAQAGQVGQFVAHADGQDQAGAAQFAAVLHGDEEAARLAAGVGGGAVDEIHAAVGGQLGAPHGHDLGRCLAVLAQEAVRVRGVAVARQAGIHQRDAAAGAGQLHGGRQAGEAAADDDGVVAGGQFFGLHGFLDTLKVA